MQIWFHGFLANDTFFVFSPNKKYKTNFYLKSKYDLLIWERTNKTLFVIFCLKMRCGFQRWTEEKNWIRIGGKMAVLAIASKQLIIADRQIDESFHLTKSDNKCRIERVNYHFDLCIFLPACKINRYVGKTAYWKGPRNQCIHWKAQYSSPR